MSQQDCWQHWRPQPLPQLPNRHHSSRVRIRGSPLSVARGPSPPLPGLMRPKNSRHRNNRGRWNSQSLAKTTGMTCYWHWDGHDPSHPRSPPLHGGADADYQHLAATFNERERVELTFVVTMINSWNRFAVGFRTIHTLRPDQDAAA